MTLSNAEIASELERTLAPLGSVPLHQKLLNEPSIASLRRSRHPRGADAIGIITLLDIDGVLVWEDGPVNATTSVTRRRRAGTAAGGDVVTQLKFTKPLGTNETARMLSALDEALTGPRPATLRRWEKKDDAWKADEVEKAGAKGPILLIIHGAFSKGGSLMADLTGTAAEPNASGRAFLDTCAKHYAEILTFDHHTVSHGPVLNAIALSRAFESTSADVDVICHSRGGLVARWWCEVLDLQCSKHTHSDGGQRQRRVVFVGSPMQGTSLADPQSLRNGLNLLSNVGRVLGGTCQLIPLLTAAGGLMQVLSSIGSLAARGPIVDAGVAMIPGIAAMSRTVNNYELQALNRGPVNVALTYFGVTSDFEPPATGWKFWRLFSKGRLADVAADYLVFDQANDLVVDTSSMTHHAFGDAVEPGKHPDRFKVFDREQGVHHVSYFQRKETIEFIAQCFGL